MPCDNCNFCCCYVHHLEAAGGNQEVIYCVCFSWPDWLSSSTFSSLLHLPLIPVSPLCPLRSTCIFAAIAAQMNSATLFGSSSLCPFTPLTHGSVSCSSPMTSTMFTLVQCGTAMKVRRGEIKNGGGGKPLPWGNFCFCLGTWRKHRCHLLRQSFMVCLTGWPWLAQWLKNHRLIGWFGSGRTFKDSLVQHPCHGLRHLSLDQMLKALPNLTSLAGLWTWQDVLSLPSNVL